MDIGFIKNLMTSLTIALVLVVSVHFIGELAVQPRAELPLPQSAQENNKSAPTPKKTTQKDPETPKAAPASLAGLLAAYDPEAGKKAIRKCAGCHTTNKDGRNRVGPNLWNIVGQPKGSVEGYKYSDALKQKGGAWTYEDLDSFLTNPRTFIVGTKMSIRGISDDAERASLIGFLRLLSDDPKPLTD